MISEHFLIWARMYYIKKKSWSPWFAWYPIKIDNKWIFLKTVLRQGYLVDTLYGGLSWWYEYINCNSKDEMVIKYPEYFI